MSNHNHGKSLSVIIPTRNAVDVIERLLNGILSQTLVPDEIIIVDSESDDQTVEIARRFDKTRIISIKQSDFDHGGTRDMAFRVSTGDIVFFFTQDAFPVDKRYIETMLGAFEGDMVAGAYARQVPYPQASRIEQLNRIFNYPAQSMAHSLSASRQADVRSFFFSNTASAIKREAYFAVGGFDLPVPTNEDMLIAWKILQKGYTLKYCAEAKVLHSHSSNLTQLYRRNFDIGCIMKLYEDRFTHADSYSEGVRFVKYTLGELLQSGNVTQSILFCCQCAVKLIANHDGKRFERYSERSIMRRTGNKAYWKRKFEKGRT